MNHERAELTRSRKGRCWAAACLVLIAGTALGAEVPTSAEFSRCMDSSDANTWKMIACMDEETARQDGALNAAYKALMRSLPPERKKQLRAAQRLWIKYRDANCKFYFDPEGGQMARVDAASCLLSETAERASELEGLHDVL